MKGLVQRLCGLIDHRQKGFGHSRLNGSHRERDHGQVGTGIPRILFVKLGDQAGGIA